MQEWQIYSPFCLNYTRVKDQATSLELWYVQTASYHQLSPKIVDIVVSLSVSHAERTPSKKCVRTVTQICIAVVSQAGTLPGYLRMHCSAVLMTVVVPTLHIMTYYDMSTQTALTAL